MAILGTADVVADMAILGTNDVVADMNTLATADVVADMNTLATADIVSDMNALATSDNITAMDTCRDNISSITNCSTNISSVNTFGDQYQVAANNPSTDGGGNTLAAGDLYFNTSANELKVYNGSSWQGGVTAAGNFASVTGNTFTGDNRYNDNVKGKFGTDSDIEIFHDGSDSYIKHNGTGNFYVQTTEASVEDLYLQAGNDVYIRVQTGENAIKAIGDGGVQLYYDGSTNPKFETTSTGAKVSSTTHSKLYITSADNNSGMINLGPSSNDDSAQIWYDDYANGMFVRTTTNTPITVYTNNTQRLVLQNDGHLRPYVDSTYDLGTSSIRWRNLYADTLYGDGSNLTGINTDLLSDTSPQLGGDLDTNSHNISLDDDHAVKRAISITMQVTSLVIIMICKFYILVVILGLETLLDN